MPTVNLKTILSRKSRACDAFSFIVSPVCFIDPSNFKVTIRLWSQTHLYYQIQILTGKYIPVLVFSCGIVMLNYCPSTGPSLLFANSPSPQRILYNTTYFTCNIGYQSSGVVNPSFTCLPLGATAGTYSAITYSCQRITLY